MMNNATFNIYFSYISFIGGGKDLYSTIQILGGGGGERLNMGRVTSM